MIRSADIINLLVNALAEDAATETFLLAQYGRRQIVAVGWNDATPLSEADCPLIALRPASGAHGQGATHIATTVRCHLVIHDPAQSAGPTGTRVRRHRYVANLAAFEQLVWVAVKTACNASNIVVSTIQVEYNDSNFPFAEALWTINCRIPQTLGAAEPSI